MPTLYTIPKRPSPISISGLKFLVASMISLRVNVPSSTSIRTSGQMKTKKNYQQSGVPNIFS